MRKILSYIVGSSLVLQMAPIAVFAAFHEGIRPASPREEIQQQREELQKEMQEKRDAMKQETREKVDAMKKETKDTRDAMKEKAMEEREAMKKEMMEKREAMQMERKEKHEQFKAEAEKRKEELKKKLGERRAANIERFFTNMMEKFVAAIDRLTKSAERISDHLDKAEANGRDVVALKEKLTAAEGKIAEAKSALDAARAKYSEAVKNTDFKKAFQDVRTIVKDVAEKVRAAHAALVDVINSIKGLGKGTTSDAGTSPATTPAGNSSGETTQ